MIKRIVTSQDLRNLCDSFRDFAQTNSINHFGDQKFCVDTIYEAWKNENLLINSCVIYANENNGFYDSVCWFVINRDFRINKVVAHNYMWISLSNHGFKCLNSCLKVLKKRKIDFINIGLLNNSPYFKKIERVLLKKGLNKDYSSYFFRRDSNC